MPLTPDQLVAKSDTEHSIQTAFFAWVAITHIPDLRWAHAVPSGGERNAIVAGRMKAEGVRSGVWDVHIPVPMNGHPGMYVEFKRLKHRNHKNGGLSDAQIEFGGWAHARGFRMKVAYTWREAAQSVCDYLGVEFHDIQG